MVEPAGKTGVTGSYSKGIITVQSSMQAIKALQETEEKFRAITEIVSVAIFIVQDGRFRYVNPAMGEISEYTSDELLSMDFITLIHQDMKAEVKKKHDTWAVSVNLDDRFEIKGIGKSGKVMWIELRGKTICYLGKPALLLTGIDITWRKQAEEALRESEERLRLCAATARLGIYDWDIVNDRHVWSPETYEIFGIPAGTQVTLESMVSYIYPEDRIADINKVELNPAVSHGEYSMEYRIHRASDEEMRWVFTKTRIFFAGEGVERRAVRLLGVIQDITRYKLAEEEIKNARSQSELYLDLMGHDINNMNQIALGYLELARDKSLDGSQQEYLDKSIEVLQRSTNLIKNVRKLQKLKESEFRTVMVDICPVLADVQREYGAVPDKPITLNLNGITHCYVQANELLYDIFSNLVTNAIKHTLYPANILIDLNVIGDNGRQYCLVMVQDDGPGISDDFKPKVFNRLLPGTTHAKGMGLGLYLVKSLIDNYHGKIWVEDRLPGDHTKGAKFVVMLPSVEKMG